MLSDATLYVLLLIISAVAFRLVRMVYAYKIAKNRMVSMRVAMVMLILHLIGFIIYGLIVHDLIGFDDDLTTFNCIMTALMTFVCVNAIIGILKDNFLRKKIKDELTGKEEGGQFCPECGCPLKGDYGFCTECGAVIKNE